MNGELDLHATVYDFARSGLGVIRQAPTQRNLRQPECVLDGANSGSAMSNLRKTPVALGIIHVSWNPVRYNSGAYPCKKRLWSKQLITIFCDEKNDKTISVLNYLR